MASSTMLGALVGMAPEAARDRKAAGYVRLDYDAEVYGRDDNRPVDHAAVERLAASIESDGLAQPVYVREVPGHEPPYELVAGQHRIAAYRLLRGRHPGDARWELIDAKVERGMDDAAAHRQMIATNVLNAEISPAQRGAWLEELFGEEAARLTAEQGGRRVEHIAELYRAETGHTIGTRTVSRSLAAHRAAEEASELGAISEWQEDFAEAGVPPAVQADIASLDEAGQAVLRADWHASGGSKRWLSDEAAIRSGKAHAKAKAATKAALDGLDVLLRCRAAGGEAAKAGDEGLLAIREALRSGAVRGRSDG